MVAVVVRQRQRCVAEAKGQHCGQGGALQCSQGPEWHIGAVERGGRWLVRWSGGGVVDGCQPIVGAGTVSRWLAADCQGGGWWWWAVRAGSNNCFGASYARQWAGVHAPIKDMHEHEPFFNILKKIPNFVAKKW